MVIYKISLFLFQHYLFPIISYANENNLGVNRVNAGRNEENNFTENSNDLTNERGFNEESSLIKNTKKHKYFL